MLMNGYEIDEAVERLQHAAPGAWPYAQYLSDWRDTVNDNSDGWSYWRAGSKCAEKLQQAVSRAVDSLRGAGEMPTRAEFDRALTPIKSFATRRNLPQPNLRPARAAGPSI